MIEGTVTTPVMVEVIETARGQHQLIEVGRYAKCACGVEFQWGADLYRTQYQEHREERIANAAVAAAEAENERLADLSNGWITSADVHGSQYARAGRIGDPNGQEQAVELAYVLTASDGSTAQFFRMLTPEMARKIGVDLISQAARGGMAESSRRIAERVAHKRWEHER